MCNTGPGFSFHTYTPLEKHLRGISKALDHQVEIVSKNLQENQESKFYNLD